MRDWVLSNYEPVGQRRHEMIDVRRTLSEAADHIERLETENNQLRAALVEAKKYNGYHQQACHLEIERLEAALQEIADLHKEFGASYIARMALNEKAEKSE